MQRRWSLWASTMFGVIVALCACDEASTPASGGDAGEGSADQDGASREGRSRRSRSASCARRIGTVLGAALQRDKAAIYTAGDRRALATFLGLVRDARAAGRDPGHVLERLREVADERVTMFDGESNAFKAGGEVLAGAVNEVWKTSFDAASLRARLARGLPDAE